MQPVVSGLPAITNPTTANNVMAANSPIYSPVNAAFNAMGQPNLQFQPSSPSGGSTGSSAGAGGGGGGGAVLGASTTAGSGSNPYGAQYAAYYQDTINQLTPQLGQLDNQQNIGLQNIDNSANLAQNRAYQQQAADQRNYQTQLGQNDQSYANNRNSILQNAYTQNNALQRLLGIAGAGNSSAAYEQAPYAAGLQASQNLFGAQNTFGQNQNQLNTNWGDYERNFNNSLTDLANQKFQQEQGLKSSIAQTRANLLNQIAAANVYRNVALGDNYQTALDARAPFQSQINNLLGQITQLGNQWQNPQIASGPVTYQAPALNNFTLQGGPAPTNSSDQSGNNGSVLPSFFNMLQPKHDQYGQPVTA